jgi:RHS repeat-associated protein
LKKKKRHAINNGTPADSEEFVYNIRNQPTLIKSGAFEQHLHYNTNLPNYGAARYNGNIAYSTWTYNGSTKGYLYYYDNLNHLNHAAHTMNGNTQYAYNEYFDYDKMGNIQYLERSADGYTTDFLNFSYNGNQITAIMDDYSTMGLYSIKEYHDKSYSNVNEMAYDTNGNLTKDLDRDIVTIKYNLLNLPDTIQFRNGNQIVNKYDAGGRKLASLHYTLLYTLPAPLTEGEVLQLYYDMDFVDETGTFHVDNIEYEYNGKEFVEMHGLDENDSEARWYYPAIMRTTTMDPLAEKYFDISPYAWCGNNPVKFVDVTSMTYGDPPNNYFQNFNFSANLRG